MSIFGRRKKKKLEQQALEEQQALAKQAKEKPVAEKPAEEKSDAPVKKKHQKSQSIHKLRQQNKIKRLIAIIGGSKNLGARLDKN